MYQIICTLLAYSIFVGNFSCMVFTISSLLSPCVYNWFYFLSLCMQSATLGSTCTSRVAYMSVLQASRQSPPQIFPLITRWLLSYIQPACPAMRSALPAAAQGQTTASHALPTATWTYSLAPASTRIRFSVNHLMLSCSHHRAAHLMVSWIYSSRPVCLPLWQCSAVPLSQPPLWWCLVCSSSARIASLKCTVLKLA